MLDLRVYRAAFVPALLAFVITAFSLGSPPRAATTTLAPDAFQGSRAFGSLGRLAEAYPARRPGGPGDEALARSVAAQMRATGLQVASDRFGRDAELLSEGRDFDAAASPSALHDPALALLGVHVG